MNPRPQPNPRKQPGQTPTAGPTPAELLAKMPRRPMTAEQQAAALEKVQQQATQRVKLGQQLFEAAEARLKQHQSVLKEIQDQQQVLRDQVQQDVAKSLQAYDQWMGQIDESFTKSIAELNQRIDVLETRFDCSRSEMEAMLGKAAALLTQTQGLLAEAFDGEMPAPMQSGGTSEFSEPIVPDHAVAAEMQASPADPSTDIESIEDMVLPPVIDEQTTVDDDAEIIEVEIVGPTSEAEDDPLPIDQTPFDTQSTRDADDVFGEVLRRLRSQDNDDDGHAAA